MEKYAYQSGVLQALKDMEFLKEAAGAFPTSGQMFPMFQGEAPPSTEAMKDNVFRQQASGQALDPMRSPPSTQGPLQVPGMGAGAKPEAEVGRAAKVSPQSAPKSAPQQAGGMTGALPAAPPMKKIQPSPYGAEQYEKGWGPGGSIERRRAAQRRALNL